MPENETDPINPQKSSMEILSELFSTFDAEPPVIVKKEKDASKKHKKSKKKHKHKSKKDKKHKKKSKKRKRSSSSSSDSSSTQDLAEILIKTERECPSKKVKVENALDCDPLEIIKQETFQLRTEEKVVEKEKDDHDIQPSDNESKIKLKDIQFSNLFESTIREIKEKQESDKKEEGILSDSDSGEISDEDVKQDEKDKHSKKKHKHRKHDEEKKKRSRRSHSKEKKRSRSNSRKRERSPKRERSRSKDRYNKSRDRDKYKEAYRDDYKYKDHKIREWDEPKYKDKDYFKKLERSVDDSKRRHKDDTFYKPDEKDDKWFMRDRYRGYSGRDREKERSSSKDRVNHIDKKKLLEIARKNAIQMMKSGSLPGALNLGPQAQEKVIAAIKSGGKTIEELTDFCKTLSKKEEMGDLSSVSEDNASESENDLPFHHPFQIKERPSSITMNIKNSIPLPIKSTQERATELRMQFPVSSGQQHRKTENEWVPVSPKKTETPTVTPPSVPPVPIPVEVPVVPVPPPEIPIVPTPINLPGPQVFPVQQNSQQSMDIAMIVSQRLTAMRKLQENPNDVEAITEMYRAQKEMNSWAESKQQIGQFTGSTGAQILSQAELSSGYQAWARKDQLQTAAPVSGGMGMHLLQKMGWKPGEGLGKEKTGALEPLLLEVKLDKKGIVAKEEQKGNKRLTKTQKATAKPSVQGKHPVSLLGEYASKHKLGVPQYSICFECGPDHKKNFLFKVILNGVEYKPNIVSPNKKEAKANAATVCLQALGILPR